MKSLKNHLPNTRIYATLSLVVVALSIVLFSSCDDISGVLDKEPTESYSDDAIWNDAALTEAFANYAYKTLPWGFQRMSWRLFPYANMVDESNSRGSFGSIGTIILGNHGPSYSSQMNVWNGDRDYWEPISQTNKFLANIDEATIDSELKERLTAEMRVLRAYAYFKLISHYGGVPLITEPFELGDDFQIPRNSYDEVYSFVITELNESMDSLPLVYDAANKGRLSRGAAMAIKARAMLYDASPLNNPENDMQKWQEAADAAKDIIDLNQYSLHDDYKTVFMEEGGYNTEEVIWGRPQNINVEEEANVERLLYPNGWLGFGHSHPIQNLIDDYEMESGLLPENDTNYDPQNPYVDRDPRFYDTINYDGAPFKERTIETFIPGGQDSPDGVESAWNATETGYYIRKFVTESYCGCNSGPSGSSSPTWIRYRYGEVLLNYAEASYELGNEETAREYLNMVRSRPSVDMPDVTETGEALWDRIVNERRIELVFEEHRFFDVRRWMIAEDVLSEPRMKMDIHKDPDTGERTFTVEHFQPANFNEWNYLAPIPQEVIDQNDLIEQNPGY